MKYTLRDIVEVVVIPIITFGVYVLYDINRNIGTLNVNVGVLLESKVSSEKRLDSIDSRIKNLEERIQAVEFRR